MKSGIEQGHQKKHPFQGNRKATTIPVHVLSYIILVRRYFHVLGRLIL